MRINNLHFAGALLIITMGLPVLHADAASWDLRNDWSDISNPNGPWSYRSGTAILPSFHWSAGLKSSQPSWGYPFADTQPSVLPAWFRSEADPVSGMGWKAGDVVVHSQDDLNGAGHGQANILWTSPISGVVDISGDAREVSQYWTMLLFRWATPLNWKLHARAGTDISLVQT